MNRLAYLPFYVVFVLGLAFLLSSMWVKDSLKIGYRDKSLSETSEYVANQSVFETRNSYDLVLEDTITGKIHTDQESSSFFWEIITPNKDTSRLFESSVVFTFRDTGFHIVKAYKDLNLADIDSLKVDESASVNILSNGGSLRNAELGDSVGVFAEILGIEGGRAKWQIRRNGELIAEALGDTLMWKADEEGEYQIKLDVEADDISLSDSLSLMVEAKKKVEKPKPVIVSQPKPVYKPKSKPKSSKKPKTEKKKDPTPSSGWNFGFEGIFPFRAGPEASSRETAIFKEGETSFTFSPKENMALQSFDYFSNYKAGTCKIQYECLSCESEREKRLRVISFTLARDDTDAVTKDISYKKIGFVKGHNYRITISTDSGVEMGFIPLSSRSFNHPSLDELRFSGSQSQIFNLVFEKE